MFLQLLQPAHWQLQGYEIKFYRSRFLPTPSPGPRASHFGTKSPRCRTGARRWLARFMPKANYFDLKNLRRSS